MKNISLLVLLVLQIAVLGQNGMRDFEMGNESFRNGNYKEAIEKYTEAIKVNKKFELAIRNRGYSKIFIGDKKGGMQDFTKAIELNPQDAYIYYLRGMSNFLYGNYEEAIKDYKKAIELNPSDEDFHKKVEELNTVLAEMEKATYICLMDREVEEKEVKYSLKILGKYFNDKYNETDTEYEICGKENKDITETARIISTVKEYKAYKNGNWVGDYQTKGIMMLDCIGYERPGGILTPLRENKDIINNIPKDSSVSFFAFNAKAITPDFKYHSVIEKKLDDEKFRYVKGYLSELLKDEKGVYSNLKVDDIQSHMGKFNDKEEVYINTYSYINDQDACYTMCLIFTYDGNEYSEQLYLSSSGNLYNIETSGYQFLDLIDIDGDKDPEIFLGCSGYEWLNLEIYTKSSNTYYKVFETNIWGL